jgi:hypothetical protein
MLARKRGSVEYDGPLRRGQTVKRLGNRNSEALRRFETADDLIDPELDHRRPRREQVNRGPIRRSEST